MPQKLLEVLMLGRCPHEFSWPRRASDGEYYQVCLLCAAEYKYDWQTMRRIERVDRSKANSTLESVSVRRTRSHSRKPTWVPRARRLKLQNPLRYRVKNLGSWHEGVIENLSQSGLLFHGAQRFPENTLVEMVFEMPEEISGQKNSTVLCQGRIIRAKESANKQQKAETAPALAASILDYKFLHQGRT
jgi:PilZ domain